MTKITRPATVLGERDGRQAGDWKSFGDASTSCLITAPKQEQDAAAGPIAWTDAVVSRRGAHGGPGFAECPACGFEHAHGGFPLFDPRIELGWRGDHCLQAPRELWTSIEPKPYQLRLAPGPARFAPGAERSRRAKRAMDFLRSIGIETSDKRSRPRGRGHGGCGGNEHARTIDYAHILETRVARSRVVCRRCVCREQMDGPPCGTFGQTRSMRSPPK